VQIANKIKISLRNANLTDVCTQALVSKLSSSKGRLRFIKEIVKQSKQYKDWKVAIAVDWGYNC
jgi:hypothetical protein